MQGHKIRVFAGGTNVFGARMWYVDCECGWEPMVRSHVTDYWGRPDWDSAFAIGVAHQKIAKELCTCG